MGIPVKPRPAARAQSNPPPPPPPRAREAHATGGAPPPGGATAPVRRRTSTRWSGGATGSPSVSRWSSVISMSMLMSGPHLPVQGGDHAVDLVRFHQDVARLGALRRPHDATTLQDVHQPAGL